MNNTNEIEIFVVKATGETEIFDKEKLAHSLRKAGASDAVQQKIITHIVGEITNGMKTADIYRHAFSLLNKHEKKAALNYSLRKAVLELGPSGFAFEKLIAGLFEKKGYDVVTGQFVKGHCVEHEMDVIASKGKELIMVEAKFHNVDGVKSDLKVALYVKARFDDLYASSFTNYGEATKLTKGLLITNTKFTHTAIEYAQCAGLELVGWNYPYENNLQDMIQESGLHPITCLANLSKKDKLYLLEKNIIFLKTLIERVEVLEELHMEAEKKRRVIKEINSIV